LALAAGAFAGLVAWAGGEWVEKANPYQIVSEHVVSGNVQLAQRARNLITKSIASYGLLGAALGLALGTVGGLTRRSGPRVVMGAVFGLVLGMVAGSGMARIMVPVFLRNEDTTVTDDLILSLLTHGAIWSVIGAASGLALGIGLGGPVKQPLLAMLGGLVGAVLGTAIYELIGGIAFALEQTGQPISSGMGSRLFARLAVGVCTAAVAGLLASPSRRPR
jgi:hypothetical protein